MSWKKAGTRVILIRLTESHDRLDVLGGTRDVSDRANGNEENPELFVRALVFCGNGPRLGSCEAEGNVNQDVCL